MQKYQYTAENMALIETSPMPFAIYQFFDSRVVTIALSRGFAELFGAKDLDDAYRQMNEDMNRRYHPEDAARVADAARRFAAEGGELDLVFRSRLRENADYTVIHAVGRHMWTPDGTRLSQVWYTREESMIFADRYDPITGLPSMTFFFELAEAGLRAERKNSAILFFDLCGMKAYNNRWGFAGGDRLIREFGMLLEQSFAADHCARFGQDHFVAYAPADGLVVRLENLFEDSKGLNDGNSLPVRVGVYLLADSSVEIGRACDLAKIACDEERNTLVSVYRFFDDRLLADAEKKRYIVDNLDRALAEGWVKVYNQPIIRAANGRVCDEEALARWIDPVKGFLSPADFIPALEEAKLIYKLDLFMVEKTIEKMRRQAEAGLYVVPESVNLSRTDFDSCDIVEEIRKRVDASGLDRSKLTIEITESVVGSDFEFIKEQVTRFQQLGFHVWMDDFGSGYSSLDVLQNIHFDVIKFDMRFMQQFDSGEEGKIILTELVKMAIGLGVETVCEGVEREDQVEFLREIGCTKIQGFYYCKPVPFETILERNRLGIQIGFENPEESEYYASLGRINLYDMGVIAGEGGASLNNYFDTIPMAIIEMDGTMGRYVRCNKSYRDFMQRAFGGMQAAVQMDYAGVTEGPGAAFMDAVLRCSRDGNRAMVDETIGAGLTVHSFIRRVAVNPVTGMTAIAAAVLAIIEQDEGAGTTYEHIARALTADYINLYYVDLDTEDFVEYSSVVNREGISVERRGGNFFEASRKDAQLFLHKDDQAAFAEAFTKENVLKAMDEQGSFQLTYRLMIDGQPMYASMKAMRMQADREHIIIGVSNVDAQVRQKEALARMQAERSSIAKITALSGDYLAIYTIDPKTGNYTEYSATQTYAGIGLARSGEDFFVNGRRDSGRVIYEEDLQRFKAMFTREKVMAEIEQNGMFSMNYRLKLDGEPKYVSMRAVMVREGDEDRLIVGVSNIDVQVKKELEYERKLSAARSRANLDGLTGVKNRTAYENMSDALTRQIEEGQAVHYAILLCRVLGLEQVNEARGHSAGDQLIRKACTEICETFKHSPVFRVAGDQFAVIAQGHDYEGRDELLKALEQDGGIACGMAQYNGGEQVAAVFARAEALCEQR